MVLGWDNLLLPSSIQGYNRAVRWGNIVCGSNNSIKSSVGVAQMTPKGDKIPGSSKKVITYNKGRLKGVRSIFISVGGCPDANILPIELFLTPHPLVVPDADS